MATVYIKPGTGSGSGTLAAPYFYSNELGTAETAAGSGGIIYFTDGDYDFTGDATFDSNGVTYQSLNPQGAVLTRTGLSSGDNAGQLNIGQASNTNAPKVKNFKIVNMRIWFYQPTGLTGNNTPLFQGCHVSTTTDVGAGTGVIRSATATAGVPVRLLDNSVHWKLAPADTFLTTRLNEATVEGNSFYFDLTNVSGTASLASSTFASSKNNIFMSSDNTKMGTSSTSALSTNCCFYQFHSNNTSGGTDNVFSDPLFVDPTNADLRLRPGSPCINAGTAS